jgi:hypothetical protein
MKNLRLLSVRAVEVTDLPSSPWFCVGTDENAPVLFFYHDKNIFKVDLATEKVCRVLEFQVFILIVHFSRL